MRLDASVHGVALRIVTQYPFEPTARPRKASWSVRNYESLNPEYNLSTPQTSYGPLFSKGIHDLRYLRLDKEVRGELRGEFWDIEDVGNSTLSTEFSDPSVKSI